MEVDTLLPSKRRALIVEKLKKEKVLTMKAICRDFEISMETLRRDINELAKDGLIIKEYGGIRIKEEQSGESIIEQRLGLNLNKKEAIAQQAVNIIQDGDCIYLDSGSTTLQIARFLSQKQGLTIFTNSIPVMLACKNTNNDIISIGGRFRVSEQSVTSYDFLFDFDKINIDKAFLCASGLSIEKGITDFNIDEVATRKKIMSISQKVFLTCDSTKFNKVVTARVCDIDDIDVLITDKEADKKFLSQLKSHHVEIIT